MCIYYKGEENLTYTTQEHVIPESLGGWVRLPKGAVSDEFNNSISKLEQDFIRNSVISIPRQFDGPGKKGRMAEQHAAKSKVVLFTNDAGKDISLGYMQRGKSKEIPALLLNLQTGHNQFMMPTGTPDEAKILIEEYIKKAQSAENLRIKRQTDERLPLGNVLIGIHAGIEENFDCFIFKNPDTAADISAAALRDVTAALPLDISAGMRRTTSPTVVQTATLKPEYLRVYAKIAFNFLAAKFGAEAALQPMFDNLRNWISGRSERIYADYSFTDPDPFALANPPLPDKSHTIAVYKLGNQLLARVAIYGLPVKVLLADNFMQEFPAIGLVCDWRKTNANEEKQRSSLKRLNN